MSEWYPYIRAYGEPNVLTHANTPPHAFTIWKLVNMVISLLIAKV